MQAFVVDGVLRVVEIVGEEFVTPCVELGVRGDHEEFGRVDGRFPYELNVRLVGIICELSINDALVNFFFFFFDFLKLIKCL